MIYEVLIQLVCVKVLALHPCDKRIDDLGQSRPTSIQTMLIVIVIIIVIVIVVVIVRSAVTCVSLLEDGKCHHAAELENATMPIDRSTD